jgi:hypothetical protein
MRKLDPKQKLLLSAEYLLDLKPLKQYDFIFANLNLLLLKEHTSHTDRPPIDRQSLLKALVFKNLRGLTNLSDLVNELSDNPSLALKCSFDIQKPLPTVETFSAFLRDIPIETLRSIQTELVSKLIGLKQIKGRYLSIDSVPIKANVKENNLKASVKDRFKKDKIPKGDPGARLGVAITFTWSFQNRIQYFWGYKNFVVSDSITELPILQLTSPANIHDSQIFIPIFTRAKDTFSLPIKGIIEYAAFDSQNILEFIIHDLKAKSYIPRNPRRKQSDFLLSSSHICIAGFEMIYWGKFKDRNRIHKKFVCPITHSKKFTKLHPVCPWMHPSFLNGKGCTTYLRADEDIRKTIDYSSKEFKKIYNLRSGSERIFSRLLCICMQNPSVRELHAITNHITIAHITVLTVALAAAKTDNHDKIRFIKTLVKYL